VVFDKSRMIKIFSLLILANIQIITQTCKKYSTKRVASYGNGSLQMKFFKWFWIGLLGGFLPMLVGTIWLMIFFH
jgi:hypothetical protein